MFFGGSPGGGKSWLELGCAITQHQKSIIFRREYSQIEGLEDKIYRFYNKRAETWWRFREALSPEQQGGSPIALPPDREVLADLAAPRFKDTPRGIQIEDKQEIAKRLGRSA